MARNAHTILERALSELSGFLLELFNRSLVNATALVDEMACGGRLAGIDVTDDCDRVISKCF